MITKCIGRVLRKLEAVAVKKEIVPFNFNNFIVSREKICQFLIETRKIEPDQFRFIGRMDLINAKTMIILGFNTRDKIKEIKNLKVTDYVYSQVDIKDRRDVFHVFVKTIQNTQIYIKIKLRVRKKGVKEIVCLSFHETDAAELRYPYLSIK